MKRKITICSVICFTFFANAASGMKPDAVNKLEKHKSVSEITKKKTNNTRRQRLVVQQPTRQFACTDAMHFMPHCKGKKPVLVFQNTSSAEPSIFRSDIYGRSLLTRENEESTDANEESRSVLARPRNVTGLKGEDYQEFRRIVQSLEAERLRSSSSKQKTNSSHEFTSEEKSSTVPQKSSATKENQQ